MPPAHYYLWRAFQGRLFRNLSLDLFFYLCMRSDARFNYVLNSLKADIIIFSHPWASPCVKNKGKKLFIYDAHNCEYLLMAQILGKHPLRGAVLKKVRKIEEDACKKSDLILACSGKEQDDLIRLYGIKPDKFVIVTNGTQMHDKTGLAKRENSRIKLKISFDDKVMIFIGAYYKPNIDALKFIVGKIATFMKEFKFLIVGSVCDFFKQQQIPQNVILLGKVSEEYLDIALSASDLAINPMFDGSGINIKMLDYMSYGLPVVTTACGARGIETFGARPMFICPPEGFIDNIKMLMDDNLVYERMSEDARGLAAEHYDWKKISGKLQDTILEEVS